MHKLLQLQAKNVISLNSLPNCKESVQLKINITPT